MLRKRRKEKRIMLDKIDRIVNKVFVTVLLFLISDVVFCLLCLAVLFITGWGQVLATRGFFIFLIIGLVSFPPSLYLTISKIYSHFYPSRVEVIEEGLEEEW